MLLSAHGLRRTNAARLVLGWLQANPETSCTHAQLQAAPRHSPDAPALLDRVTLYRLMDRLTQVGLIQCSVDASRTRRYQARSAKGHASAYFECQSCHRGSPLSAALSAALSGELKTSTQDNLQHAAQIALKAFKALGYQGTSVDFAVRGVRADCVVSSSANAEGAAA